MKLGCVFNLVGIVINWFVREKRTLFIGDGDTAGSGSAVKNADIERITRCTTLHRNGSE